MKIRTDFVTNSSSSSYITIIAEFKNGPRKKAELQYDTGLPVSAAYTAGARSGKELPDQQALRACGEQDRKVRGEAWRPVHCHLSMGRKDAYYPH